MRNSSLTHNARGIRQRMLKRNSAKIARFASQIQDFHEHATRFTDCRFHSSSCRRDATRRNGEKKKKERRRNAVSKMYPRERGLRILESNYYPRSLNARVVLNMARAALIKGEGVSARLACTPGQKPKRAARRGAAVERASRYRRSKMRSKNCRQFELLIRTMRESYLGRSSA